MLSRILMALSVVASGPAVAAPKTIIERINGFEVHLVDVGRGDGVGVAFFTPYGARQDQWRMMGRAHFLEHYLHNGSKAFPGYHTFDEMLNPTGASSNAFTSTDKTFYFVIGKQAHAKILLPLHLAMLGGLEWNSQTFKKQIEAVIDEIVHQGLPKENDAINMMPFTHLLPADHPWALVPTHGDGASLPALTIEDMKDLYYRAYGPDAVRVVVAGNFSKPGNLTEVRTLLKQHLLPFDVSQDPNGFKPRGPSVIDDPVPSIVTTHGQRLVLHSDTMMAHRIVMEADLARSNSNSAITSLVISYLNLRVQGSLLHKLITELGWVHDAGFWTSQFPNRLHFNFYADLTAEGLKHEREIERMMFTTLADLHRFGIPEETLAALTTSSIKSMEKMGRDIHSLIQGYAGIFADDGDISTQSQDLLRVSNSQIRNWAGTFRADRALYALLQPSAQGMSEDPRFKRKFKIEDHRERIDQLTQILVDPAAGRQNFAVHLKPVDLGSVAAQEQRSHFSQSRREKFLPVRATFDLRKDLPDTALITTLRLSPQRVQDLAAVDIVLEAFRERYMGELTTIEMKYFTRLSVVRTINEIQFSATGEDRLAAKGLTWLVDRLAAFDPSVDELERARQSLASNLLSEYVGSFSAAVALATMSSSLDPLRATPMQTRDSILSFPVETLAGPQWRTLMDHSHREIVMVGDLTEGDGTQVLQAIDRLSPRLLKTSEARKLADRLVWQPAVWSQNFPPGRNDGTRALVRLYQGPELTNVKAVAAFKALGSVIGKKVYILNREERGLGYVHSASTPTPDRKRLYLALYGQTKGLANVARTMDGWNTVLRGIADGSIGDTDLEAGIQDVRNQWTADKTSAPTLAQNYASSQSIYLNARMDERLAAAAAKLTAQDVRAVARQYVLDSSVRYRQLTLGDCESVLFP